MAVELKKKKSGSGDGDDERRRAEARQTREQFGIEHLHDDEELIDDDTFSVLQDHLHVARDTAEAGSDAPAEGSSPSEGSSPAEGSPPAEGSSPDDAEEDELLLEEIATVLPSQSGGAVAESRPPADAAEVAELERALAIAKDRDEVAALTLRIARYHARAAALFVLSRGLLAGLRGAGEGLEARLEGIMMHGETESLLTRPIASGRMVRGEPPAHPMDQRILRAMGRESVRDLAVLPIRIGSRVVNLLYVDNGSAPLSDTGLGALRVLCAGVGRVYERLILEAKRTGRPPSA